ncbi:DUF4410 domain-containing protein [Rodentibacter abscessus]|uniref:DUF4410 domain-containing protein n=1 Tax=Rodentibacter abscessus TaxID=3381777 RepID=UPI00399CEBEA
MKILWKLIGFLFVSVLLSACSSMTLDNNLKQDMKEQYTTYKIVNVSSNEAISSEVTTIFENNLRAQLQKYGYKEGNDVVVSYDIKAFDEGNRALRMFIGFGAGKGTLSVTTTLKDKNGVNLGSVNAETTLRMGFFGGSLNNIIASTAKKTAVQIRKSRIINAH